MSRRICSLVIDAMICWFTEKKLRPRARFHLRHTTHEVRASVTDLLYKVDITHLRAEAGTTGVRPQ